ncbi:hypothetical protein GIB67_018228 [Kingdonia uniflora]|nr:hypothetical protein GIB67_035132 [Kingdonia uniflora]KAF6140708.1 hypothetical protein GIB67_035135 [Kingdonia uniflora]KAF6168388.1 hypothetical protein GIB67_018228 [Kingdonia uniflora]
MKFASLLLLCVLLNFINLNNADQIEYLDKLIKSRKSDNPPLGETWPALDDKTVEAKYAPVYIGNQDGLMEADKIDTLPGQPEGVDFDQYSGYVTVNHKHGRALFYYFVESPQNSSTNPLVLWLNGGPGCSSMGYGAMEELGPFRVNSDGKTLYRNNYSWNNAANVIFLESPAGVGFSYSNTTSDYDKSGDKRTATDAYIFLVSWLERFPQYKTRDFFIAGESYSGHYVPQLAYTIIQNNKNTNQTVINLKGIAIGNALIDYQINTLGMLDYFWGHALNSDEVYEAVHKYCDFTGTGNITGECSHALDLGFSEIGNIDIYNIYAPLCHDDNLKNGSIGSVDNFDPCSDNYVYSYLNLPEVQKAFHAKPSSWDSCSDVITGWHDSPATMLPTIKQLIASGIRLWIYSGDTDARCPITASRYSINMLKLPIVTEWRPWYINEEVGGYVVEYEGVVLTTVRGAGHLVPSYQPARALAMISSFLQGKLPPPS